MQTVKQTYLNGAVKAEDSLPLQSRKNLNYLMENKEFIWTQKQ